MFHNYLITAINNFIKNRLYSFINIFGLSIGLAACVLIGVYVNHEVSFDTQWSKAERIYGINGTVELNVGEPQNNIETSFLLAPALNQFFADDIEEIARVSYPGKQSFRFGEDLFELVTVSADPELTKIFDFEVLSGNLEETMKDRYSIALREDTARRIFGDRSPIGEALTMNALGLYIDYKVGAVYRAFQGNTVLDFPVLLTVNEQNIENMGLAHWYSLAARNFVLLKEGASVSAIESQMKTFVDQHVDISSWAASQGMQPSERVQFSFQKMSDVYLNAPLGQSSVSESSRGNFTLVVAFSAIAALILVIASINFVVLTTSKAASRAQEVALRKVHGAKRKHLVIQFLGESLFVVVLAIVIALGLAEFLLPTFEAVIGKDLQIPYSSLTFLFSMLFLIFVVSNLGGAYPALILSAFRPVVSLKANQSTETSGSIRLRNVLVIFQFAISTILIIATVVIYTQTLYASKRDPGFVREGVILVDGFLFGSTTVRQSRDTFKQELLKIPEIQNASLSRTGALEQVENSRTFTRLDSNEKFDPKSLNIEYIDPDFFDVYGIGILAGRNFEEVRDPEILFDDLRFFDYLEEGVDSINIVANESAIREFGYSSVQDAIGQDVETAGFGGGPGSRVIATIVGVVRDTQFLTLHEPAKPVIYLLSESNGRVLSIRFQGNPRGVMASIESVWDDIMGNEILKAWFLEQAVAQQFEEERLQGSVLTSFSLLAVLIACMGLFASASFTTEKRTKEIGLRKVMGAKVKNIVRLLLWQFSTPVVIANLIAWPAAVYIMNDWLQRFPYQIDVWFFVPICLLSGLLALLIAWLTVSVNTVRVARSNPIYALRYE